MTTDDDTLPPAWQAALEGFADAYGGEPDLENRTDRILMVQLLESAVHAKITREVVKSFREATARIEAQTRALEEQRR